MIVFLVFLAAIAPVVWLMLIIYRKDIVQPEPTKWLVKAFFYGVGSVFLSLVVSKPMSVILGCGLDGQHGSIIEAIVDAFFLAAIPEELTKLLMLWLLLRKNPFFDEHFDGIVYAVCVGLGFAALENVFYLFSGIGDFSWIRIGVLRALISVPGHYFFAIIMGYYYSIYHFGIDMSTKAKAMILVAPILAHGVFDAILMSAQVSASLGGILLILFVVFFTKLKKRAKVRIDELSKQAIPEGSESKR